MAFKVRGGGGGMATERKTGWQDAVATLTRERELAVAGVTALKAGGDQAAIAQGTVLYGEGKAAFDGVIAGLLVVIRTTGGTPDRLQDLTGQVQRGSERRQALGRLVPPARRAIRGIQFGLSDLTASLIGPLVAAVTTLYHNFRADDHLRRETIAHSLEAARWPAFDTIPPG